LRDSYYDKHKQLCFLLHQHLDDDDDDNDGILDADDPDDDNDGIADAGT
jgi:hypothetical protein